MPYTGALDRLASLISPLICIAFAATACRAGGSDSSGTTATLATTAAVWDSASIDTLLRLRHEDQAGRDQLARAAAAGDTAAMSASLRADSARTRWLRSAVESYGWPSRTVAGDSAQQAAWLMLQHSPDTAWQAAMLPRLEQLSRDGELPAADVAMLMDRVLAGRGQPQRYGSQFNLEDGRLVPAPVEKIEELDVRRASAGLPPMADYVRLLAEYTKLEVVWPPPR